MSWYWLYIEKGEIEPSNIQVTVVNFSNENVHLDKNAFIGTLHQYTGHRDEQDILIVETNLTELKNENVILPCTPKDAIFVCSPTDADTHRRMKLEGSHLDPKVQEIF